jgi:hypothetical protein
MTSTNDTAAAVCPALLSGASHEHRTPLPVRRIPGQTADRPLDALVRDAEDASAKHRMGRQARRQAGYAN